MMYQVNDIYTCIQGEGCQTGVAMVLVRLHGCDVGCSWCDTKETWPMLQRNQVETLDKALGSTPLYAELTAEQIAQYCSQKHPGPRWVLLTGGEPALQPLGELVQALHKRGYQVALETSGTALGHLNTGLDWICVSPKLGMPGGRPVLPEAVAVADEIKHVVGCPDDIEKLGALLTTYSLKKGVQVCLQPLSTNATATSLCLEKAKEKGWRLSVQVHKYLKEP